MTLNSPFERNPFELPEHGFLQAPGLFTYSSILRERIRNITFASSKLSIRFMLLKRQLPLEMEQKLLRIFSDSGFSSTSIVSNKLSK